MGKLSKKLKRKKRIISRNNANRARMAIQKGYPSFFFLKHEDNVPEILVEKTKGFFSRFNFGSLVESKFYKMMRKIGFDAAIQKLSIAPDDMLIDIVEARHAFEPGECLFRYLDEINILKDLFPFCDVLVIPRGQHFTVKFRALDEKSTKRGKIYFKKGSETVSFDDKKYIFAMHAHAIERIGERSVINPKSYAGHGDVFGIIDGKIIHLPIKANNKLFVAIYSPCAKGTIGGVVLNVLVKNPAKYYDNCYGLIGYCPVVLSGEYARAKTFLTPGMRGTPEALALDAADMSKEEKEKIATSFKNASSYRSLIKTADFGGMIWAHAQGIDQIAMETNLNDVDGLEIDPKKDFKIEFSKI